MDLDVEIAHRAVVVAARHLQLIFNFGELVLQLQEVLVGLELRIGLGEREQPPRAACSPRAAAACPGTSVAAMLDARVAATSSSTERSCAA